MKTKSNKVKDIRDHYLAQLSAMYPPQEAATLFDMLLEGLLEITKMHRLIHPQLRLSESEMLKVHFAIKDLLNEKPVQYILGFSEFFGLHLEVNSAVLIPRPETEELVAWIVDEAKGKMNLKILDIGTGSGAIALALDKQLPAAQIEACDNSAEALAVARNNASALNANVHFVLSNILLENEQNCLGSYDIIVSNPPYVRQCEKELMQNNVLNYEPAQALFVPDENPFLFYQAIIRFAEKHLPGGGKLYLEINENYGDEICDLLTSKGFMAVEMRQDLYQRPRMVRAQKR